MNERPGQLLRALSPLVILALSAIAVLAPWLPGGDWFAAHLGSNFVLSCCVAVLALYVLLLWGESIRLHAMLTAVLKALQDFRAQRPADGKGEQRRHRLEAVRLLIPALASADAKVRSSAHDNLVRLAGRDLGEAEGPWQQWLAAEEQQVAKAAEGRSGDG